MIQNPRYVRAGSIFMALSILWLAAMACDLPTAALTPGAPTQPPATPSQPTKAANSPQPGAPTPSGGAQVFEVTIYLVALDDGGASGQAVGCGDSLVAVNRPVAPTDQPVQAALNELFAIKEQYFGQSGLYTALYQSNLSVDSALVDASGTANVSLTGSFLLGGECDTPRFIGQIEQTVLAAPGVTAANILLNGKPLEEALSLR